MTAFVALLALDERRVAARRLDAAPCLRLPAAYFGAADPAAPAAAPPAEPVAAGTPPGPADDAGDAEAPAAGAHARVPEQPSGRPETRALTAAAANGAAADAEPGASGRSAQLGGMERGAGPAGASDVHGDGSTADRGAAGGKPAARRSTAGAPWPGEPVGVESGRRPARGLSSALQGFMARRYAPWLLRPAVRAGVLGVFLAGLLASLAVLPHISKCAPPAAPPPGRERQLQFPVKAVSSTQLPCHLAGSAGRCVRGRGAGAGRVRRKRSGAASPGQPAERRACVACLQARCEDRQQGALCGPGEANVHDGQRADTAPARRGLEQQVALPRDSYLQPYYADVFGALRVGPPLLLVVRGLNMSARAPDVDAVCSTAGCRDDSLLNRVRAIGLGYRVLHRRLPRGLAAQPGARRAAARALLRLRSRRRRVLGVW